MRTVASAAAWMAAGAVAATVLTGVALASTSPSTLSPASVEAAAGTVPGQGMNARGMMRDVLHGSFTVDTGDGTAVVDVQRGQITAASATSISVRSSDGFTATYAVDGSTAVRRDRAAAEPGDLVVGDTALVRATSGTADVVRALSPEALQKLKDSGAAGWGSRRSGMGMGGGMGSGMGSGMGGMGLDADDV